MSAQGGFVPKSATIEKLVEPFVDTGNLLLIDRAPIDDAPGVRLQERARDNTQYLLNEIWKLERERVAEVVVAKLPKPSFRIPREKRIPEPRVPTKWEEYAKAKGIVKKKRDKKVFDEASGDWKPRYGKNRAKTNEDWIIEVPDHKDPNVDYFEEKSKEKKERVAKNELQRLRNITRAQKKNSSKEKVPNAAPMGVTIDPEERSRAELIATADRAKKATASGGKFQEKLRDEKPPKNTGKRHQFLSNEKTMDEKKRQLEILAKLTSKKPALVENGLDNVAKSTADFMPQVKKTSGHTRQKSAIHRQQHFQSKLKQKKKTRGNVRGPSKAGGKKKGAKT